MVFEFFSSLSQNLSYLLDEADDYNTIITVGENPNTKEFRAHSIILRARSPYFKSALSKNWISEKNNMINFTKPNISPTVFEMIIRYMYGGILDLNKQNGADILDLLVASDELLIDELIIFIQQYLIEKQVDWLQQNFFKVLLIAYQSESCKKLLEHCLEIICKNPETFFNSPNFSTLDKSILLRLFEEALQIEEVELWNYLVKWGIAQTSELNGKRTTDLESWNETDFLALKNTLDQFISHIRFFEMSSIEFHNSVWPFREVLPKKLFESIISFHMANIQPQNMLAPRYSKIAVYSNIIKSKHATILTNWIQRKDANARIPIDNKYKFNLIYRGSRDGYDNNTIRNNCSGHGACILVIKIKENETIIGGYNPIGWNYNGHNPNNYSRDGGWRGARGGRGRGGHRFNVRENYWVKTSESFIFSLGDGKSLKNPKISRVVNPNNAIYESKFNNIALNFGNSDLIINGNAGTCIRQYYDSSILDTIKFNIEEMEIFYQNQDVNWSADRWNVPINDNNDSFCVASNNDNTASWIGPQHSFSHSFGLTDALSNANNVPRGTFASTYNNVQWGPDPSANETWVSWPDESNDDSWDYSP